MAASDVVIIGAGIVGSSTAYYLAKAGVAVTLLDRRGSVPSGAASQASAGGVRHQGREPHQIPLAIFGLKLWPELGQELEAELHYRRDGMSIVTNDEALIPALEGRVEQEQALGLEVRMVYAEELRRLVPGLSPHMLAGSYCPLDGHADPMRTVNALVRGAERQGARVMLNRPATGLAVEKGRLAAVRTAQGDIPCRLAVLAAGAWSPALAAGVGLELPFQTFPLQMMVTARRPHVLDQVLGWLGHGLSLKQVPPGGFVIGGGWPGHGDLQTYATRLLPGSMAKSAQTALAIYPALAGVPVIRAWLGLEAFCADEMEIVGPAPGLSGLILAAGFSGHGFAIGPGVGLLMAEYIVSGRLSKLLQPFSIERFQNRSDEEE